MDACLSFFSSKRDGDDREPLLPRQRRQPQPHKLSPPPDESLSKLADVLAALSAGKLPSQTQINNFLQRVLQLNLLHDTQDARPRPTPDVLKGNGPLSKRGRKVIQDLEEVIQALLQFGTVKNDDDLLQDLFFQLYQIDTDVPSISTESSGEGSVETDKAKKSAGEVKDRVKEHAPKKSEISADAKTMLNAVKILGTTFVTSSMFRLVLADAISIGQDLIAHVASDVSSAALRVHDIAQNVERRTNEADLDIGTDTGTGAKLKGKISELVDEGKAAASNTAQGVRESMSEKKEEWEKHGAETEEVVKGRLIARIQGMVVRAREDPSSRRAIVAILQIVRKYAHKFVLASQQTTPGVQGAVEKGVQGRPGADKDEQKSTGSAQEVPIGFADASSYPPQPYGTSTPKLLIPGIEIDSPHLQYVLEDAKEMIERIAQGHKIDDMMGTLGDVIRHTITTPEDLRRNVEGLTREKLQYDVESSSVKTAKHTEHTKNWMDDFGEASGSSDGEEKREQGNLLAVYFSSVGRYLDKALDEPGWATSNRGRKALETLYDATQDLLHIAGDIIADAEDIVKDGFEQADDIDQAKEEMGKALESNKSEEKVDKGKGVQGWHADDRGNVAAGERAKGDVQQATNRWVRDIAKLLKQVGDYVDAMERDRTTMKLARALETLREDMVDIFDVGKQQMGKAAGKVKTRMHQRAEATGRLGFYTQWLGWGLPRLLRLLPLGAIPVPRVEFRTDDMEGAVDALWIRGAALKSDMIGGRYGAVSGHGGPAPGASWQGEAAARGSKVQTYDEGGIGGKLVPDEVLVRQWTEVRVTLAEGHGAAAIGADDAQSELGLTRRAKKHTAPGIESTSRLRVCMDGIKACVRGMGYYVRYGGSALFTYEDEGVLSVDLGTTTDGGRHSGLGLDIELEMDSSDVEMDLDAANPVTEVPLLVVEDIETDSDIDPEVPQNLDVQEAVHEACHYHYASVGKIGVLPQGPSRAPINLALANVVPLFRVFRVHVNMRGMKFRFDKSRHWILNKVFVQPFAGPIMGNIAKSVLEERLRKGLEAMSRGAALVLMEAKERAINRRMRAMAENKRKPVGADSEEDGKMKISDIYAALLERGPEIFAYYTDQGPAHTETHAETTGRGIVYSRQTHTQVQQPVASGSMVIPPPALMDDEGNLEDPSLLREEGAMGYPAGADQVHGVGEETKEVTVTVGTGAQLFPGKGGPYGAPKDTGTAGNGLAKDVRKGAEGMLRDIKEGTEQVTDEAGRVKREYESAKGKERRKMRRGEAGVGDWWSPAFDL